jgi:4-hydroxy-tetrahydrodipicolinate synthase
MHHPKIAAVKDCGGNIETTMALINDGHAEVLTGEDVQIFTNLVLGGAGAISASAHIRPDLYVRMMQQSESGDVISARAMLYQLLPWIQVAFSEPSPAVIKAALSMQGLIKNELRQPMLSCSSTSIAHLERLLANLIGSPALQTT